MIRPVNFAFNAQTAVNNAFQMKGDEKDIHDRALREFDQFVEVLRNNEVDVFVVDDTPLPHTPDSIFPNNWISFHRDGTLVLYPMYAENRRLERKSSVIAELINQFDIKRTVNLSDFEHQNKFLEGTGSMVLDREKHIAYACLSPRTDQELLNKFCRDMNYQAITFISVDQKNNPIYHTNVMMCVADKYVVICLDSIPNENERSVVSEKIAATGKEIISITLEQMNRFAGNMLQVKNDNGEKLLVMSTQAFQSLHPNQLQSLQQYNRIIHSSLNVIEQNGGGSARCMMAEVYLPKKNK